MTKPGTSPVAPARYAAQLLVGAVWLGLVVGLAFIETPLKFQAPGITTPLALGIGRLVFISLNVLGVLFAFVLTALTVRGRASWAEDRPRVLGLATIWAMLALEILVFRPLLWTRTDTIIAGGDPGESYVHVAYGAAEFVLVAALVWYLAVTFRALR